MRLKLGIVLIAIVALSGCGTSAIKVDKRTAVLADTENAYVLFSSNYIVEDIGRLNWWRVIWKQVADPNGETPADPVHF